MESRRIGALAGVVGVLGLVAQYVPPMLLERLFDGGLEGAVPTVGTTGQTATLYSLLGSSFGPVATLALAVGLGYYAGRRIDVAREYRRFGGVVAAGSVLGVAAVWAGQSAVGGVGSPTATSVLLSLVVLASLVARVSLVVAVGALAGAALSHFRTSDPTSRRPTEADAGGPASRPPSEASEESDANSSTLPAGDSA